MATRPILVWGIHAARAALDAASTDILELWLRDGDLSPELIEFRERAEDAGITPQFVPPKTLSRLSDGAVHQGVVLRRRLPAAIVLEEFLAAFRDDTRALLLLVLDRVQDPHNLGACLRVADGAGVDAVIVARDHCAPITGVVAKAASGALDSVALITVTNLARAIDRLHEHGIRVVGLSHAAQKSLHAADLRPGLAVVCGGEGSGMRRLTQEKCDELVAIPMHGSVASLNVSTAVAVALFEAARQRGA